MKKIIVTLLVIACISNAYSQKFTLGLKAGVNVTNFTGGNFNNLDKQALIGFHGGGFFSIRFASIAVQPEVLVSTAGATFKNADSSFKLTYLSVPVMVKIIGKGGFYFEIGPQVSFKLGEDVSNQTIGDFAKNLDLAGGAGIGFQSKKGFGIGARYLVGLSKVGDFQATSNLDPDFKNSIIQAGIYLPLTK